MKHWNCPEAVTLQACSDEVCVYHLSLCVNILLGSSPSIFSGMTTFSPLCLPTDQRVHKFYSDRSPDLVRHCTQYDSQRCLLKTDLSTAIEAATEPRLPALTGTCPCRVLGGSVWFDKPGFLGAGQEAPCADGSRTKG